MLENLVMQSAGSSVVSTLLTGAADGMKAEITTALPIAGGLFAVVAGIFMGLKIFKRVTGARS